MDEVRSARKSLDHELKKDPHGFMHRAIQEAIKAGFKISTLKPVKTKVLTENKK